MVPVRTGIKSMLQAERRSDVSFDVRLFKTISNTQCGLKVTALRRRTCSFRSTAIVGGPGCIYVGSEEGSVMFTLHRVAGRILGRTIYQLSRSHQKTRVG